MSQDEHDALEDLRDHLDNEHFDIWGDGAMLGGKICPPFVSVSATLPPVRSSPHNLRNPRKRSMYGVKGNRALRKLIRRDKRLDAWLARNRLGVGGIGCGETLAELAGPMETAMNKRIEDLLWEHSVGLLFEPALTRRELAERMARAPQGLTTAVDRDAFLRSVYGKMKTDNGDKT